MAKLEVFLIAVVCTIARVNGHGRLMNPPSRSSVWRIEEFESFEPPINYDDDSLYCGSIHQEGDPGANCGVCGDPASHEWPRDNENGGRYGKGIITGNYSAGQTIDVEVELTRAHRGNMQWRLCTDVLDESQNCFNQHVLKLADGSGSESKLPVTSTGWYKTQLKLPDGIRCNHCVIQWNYRAGNNWGQCDDGSFEVGCGPQETFRGCADVSIS